MRFPSRNVVEGIRKRYPIGTRVELVFMDDIQAPPVGTKGTVEVLMILALLWFLGITEVA